MVSRSFVHISMEPFDFIHNFNNNVTAKQINISTIISQYETKSRKFKCSKCNLILQKVPYIHISHSVAIFTST